MRENVDWAPRGLEEVEVEEASLESESARPRGQAGPSHTLNWEYARLRHHPTSDYNRDDERRLNTSSASLCAPSTRR